MPSRSRGSPLTIPRHRSGFTGTITGVPRLQKLPGVKTTYCPSEAKCSPLNANPCFMCIPSPSVRSLQVICPSPQNCLLSWRRAALRLGGALQVPRISSQRLLEVKILVLLVGCNANVPSRRQAPIIPLKLFVGDELNQTLHVTQLGVWKALMQPQRMTMKIPQRVSGVGPAKVARLVERLHRGPNLVARPLAVILGIQVFVGKGDGARQKL